MPSETGEVFEIEKGETSRALELAQQAIDVKEKLHEERGITKVAVRVSIAAAVVGILSAAWSTWQTYSDRLDRVGAELRTVVTRIAQIQNKSYNEETNILAKQGYVLAKSGIDVSAPEYVVIADALFATDDVIRAREFASIALAKADTSLDKSWAYRSLGGIAMGSGKYQEAIADYNLAVGVFYEFNEDPASTWALSDIANTKKLFILNAVAAGKCEIAREQSVLLLAILPKLSPMDRQDISSSARRARALAEECNGPMTLSPTDRSSALASKTPPQADHP